MRTNIQATAAAVALSLVMPIKSMAAEAAPAVSPNVMIATLPGDNKTSPAAPSLLPQAVRSIPPVAPFISAFPAIPDARINGTTRSLQNADDANEVVPASAISQAICDSLIVDGAKPAKPSDLNFGCNARTPSP